MYYIKQIVTGSAPIEQKQIFDRSIYNLCVIHLIDSNSIMIDVQEIEAYITDQFIELWNSLRDGDLIEDVNTNRIFAVIQDDQQETSEFIIKNGIKIIDLNWSDEEQEYLLPLEFKAITRFPIGYHDYSNMIVNNTYARMYTEPTSEWSVNPCKVPLDIQILKLDPLNLMNDQIFSIRLLDKVLTYVVLNFRGVKYLIGTDDIEQVFRYRLKKQYQTPHYGNNALEYFGSKYRQKLIRVLKKETVDYNNFLLI